ncbi:MAG TPA: hypothetical protein VMW67_02765 [Desulfobacteria bacterium]|nr:hypothetical protein [Desulfobacteria bacterium]
MGKIEIRRLVLAKKLYLHGCGHAVNKDEISKMLAIHNFDNVIELVLKCVATNFDIQNKKKNLDFKFKDLWNITNEDEEYKKKNGMLPLKTQMFDLHDLRNTIQHQGDIPSYESVIKYKGYSEDFFRGVTEKIFNISYDGLYLSALIENEKLKKKVLNAEKAFADGDFRGCIKLCDGALIVAVFHIGDIPTKAGLMTGYWGASDELKEVFRDDCAEKYKDTSYYNFAQEISKALLQLGQASTSMQFLDEFRMDFLRHREQVDNLSDLPEEELKDSAQFSLDFVTNVILRWQEMGILKRGRGDD